MKPTLESRYTGCLVGAALGDISGAPVEAESPAYIRKTFPSVDDILRLDTVPELFDGKWKVGRYTDDTAMMLAVAEWLIDSPASDLEALLRHLSKHYDPSRRFGPGTSGIIEMFRQQPEKWKLLASAFFSDGSYGNGSATRVAPVGLFWHFHLPKLRTVAIRSSNSTHTHPLARQGSVLIASAVALAIRLADRFTPAMFLELLNRELNAVGESGDDTTLFEAKMTIMTKGLRKGVSPAELVDELGNGIKAQDSVPIAIYCFLHSPDSYRQAVTNAIYLGGDTDTIACMTGAISGAYLGAEALPKEWTDKIRDQPYGFDALKRCAEHLFDASMREKHRLAS